MTNVMLCMIVRNEAEIIERCIDAALPAIDAASICDTGSDDATIDIITSRFQDAGRPCQVPVHQWTNFGVNRSQSFEAAREFARELGWNLEESYALFLDADMVLRIGLNFDASTLKAIGYYLTQIHGSMRYENLRLARMDVDWSCVGATHEYWTPGDEDPSLIESLPSLVINDIGDGGAKADKFERDIRLLIEELETEPDNPRTVFYLAQSYFDTGQYEKARELYRKRVDLGAWEEECWYAGYKAGRCSLALEGESERGIGELLEAWEKRPSRAEPLYELAQHARSKNQHHLALMAAEQALAIAPPQDDRLFIDLTAYDSGPAVEISISSYYAGRKERGAAACDALQHRRGTAQDIRYRASLNSVFYAQPITTHEEATRVEVPFSLWQQHFSPSVGSIQRSGKGYRMVNRLVNYHHEQGHSFLTRDQAGQYITRNIVIDLDRNLKTRSASEIDDAVLEAVADFSGRDVQIKGIEDIRLFRWNGEWWFTGNSRQFRSEWVWQVVLGKLNRSCNRMESILPLDFVGIHRQEKNWMPFVHDGRLLLLYAADPTLILEPDLETGVCRVVSHQITTANLDSYRGSSPFVPFNGRLLGIVHEVAATEDRRTYLHRFIILDPETWTISHASHPFTFLHTGVEYCCGMTWAHERTDLLISFSFEERESWIARIDRDRVRQMLKPIESLTRLMPIQELRPDPAPRAYREQSSRPQRPRWPARRHLLRSGSD